MSEAVKVIVRCRPLNKRENDLECQCVVSMDSARGQCSIINPNDPKAPPKHFFFDGSYFTNSTTEQIYADIAYPLVEGVTEGYNGTIFAYGQTGCGKSFTMQGIQDPPTQRGIIPRSFEHIFETIAISDQSRYLVHASYLEIYNEDIRDLLGKDVKARLELKEHPEKGVYVAGLSMHKVANVRECQVIMDRGWKNRSTGATLMNMDSSRSHSIFTISLERTDAQASSDDEEQHIRAGKLNLVDLAGSERQSKSGATGERLKEATKINLSLSALGNVISALVDGKSKHIPYRDSKLTRLLQDSLGGNTKTLMVACLSPADNNFDETLSTLRYANRAKNIQNKPKINEDPKDALLREYQQEIERLKAMLMGQGGPAVMPVGHMQLQQPVVTVNTMEVRTREIDPAEIERQRRQLEEEKERIRREYEERLQEKEGRYKSEAADKARLMEDMKKLRQYYDDKIEKLDERYRNFHSMSESHSRSKSRETEVVPTIGESVTTSSVLIVTADGETAAVPSAPPQEFVLYNDDKPPPYSPDGNSQLASLNQPPRHAKHVKTHQKDDDRRTAPENGPGASVDNLSKEELLARLRQLENSVVGGEQSENKDLKEHHRRRNRHVQKRMQKFREAVKDMDDEEIMFGIFENIQDEVRAKNKLLNKEKERVRALEQDIDDLHAEFERDRTDYLDTIREQEKRLKLYQSIMEKMVAGVRKDSNYTNIDRIISMSKWNSEKEQWTVPSLTIEKVHLPPTGDELVGPGGQRTSYSHRRRPQDDEYSLDSRYGNGNGEDDDALYQKLAAREHAAQDYFTNKRANKLLQGRAHMDEMYSQQEPQSYGGRYPEDYGESRHGSRGGRYLDAPQFQDESAYGGIRHSHSTPDDLSRRPHQRLGTMDSSPTSATARKSTGRRRTGRGDNY